MDQRVVSDARSKIGTMTRLSTELDLALSVVLVGGAVFGVREALVTLEANAFVQPGQYFAVYLAASILVSVALGVIVLLPVAAARALCARTAAPRHALPVYAARSAFGPGAALVGPWGTGLMAPM